MSLPKHRVTLISRSKMAAEEAVVFLRSTEQRESRESARKIFINKYTGLVEQKRGEWPTQATMTDHMPGLVESTTQPEKTILDEEVKIDQLMLEGMAQELDQEQDSDLSAVQQTPGLNVIDIRAAIKKSAVTADEAHAHLVEASSPQEKEYERFSEAA